MSEMSAFCRYHSYLVLIIILNDVSALDRNIMTRRHAKRQVTLDDIIESALNFVRPIIDTSQPLQNDATIAKQASSRQLGTRDGEILGAPKYNSLDEVPICKGNSKICKFVSCTAHNFKSDQSFANINLAAQVLADKKLRQAISRDPDALETVCHEQGLGASQCRLFQKGFQLVDRFITSIEPAENLSKKTEQFMPKEDDFYMDDSDAPPIPIRPSTASASKTILADDPPARGSRTWSSHPQPVVPVDDQPMLATLPTFPPLLFTLPTFPPIPTLPPITPLHNKDPLSPFPVFNFNNQFFKHLPFLDPAKQLSSKLVRLQRSVDHMEDSLQYDNPYDELSRRKRDDSDYYSDLESGPSEETQKRDEITENIHSNLPLEDERIKPVGKSKKANGDHMDCFQFLQ